MKLKDRFQIGASICYIEMGWRLQVYMCLHLLKKGLRQEGIDRKSKRGNILLLLGYLR